MVRYSKEEEMYPDIINNLKFYFNLYGYENEIFETWHKFDSKLMAKYRREIDVLGFIGRPDIMAIYKKGNEEKTLIIEVKKTDISLLNIAQAKMYGDIFNTDKVFLVGPYDLRNVIKDYYTYNTSIFRYGDNREIKYVRLEDKKLLFQNAFPVGGDML